jgi:putative PIN family toxin of toxin-antitoxin system
VLRAVLDANVLVSALIRPEGPPGRILVYVLEKGACPIIVSDAIVAELRRCLRYSRVRKHILASDKDLDLWVSALELLADTTEGVLRIEAVAADPDDDKYVVAALEGRADFLVSGDEHLLALREYEGVRIVTPRAFLTLLERRLGSPGSAKG